MIINKNKKIEREKNTMKKITFYTNPRSRGAIVRWMLEECGAEYDVVPVHFGKEMKSEKYLSVNPMGKSPALEVDGKVITETAAILIFLADMYPEKNLIPLVNSLERGEFYRWMFFLVQLEYAFIDKFFDVPSSEERRRSVGYGDYDTALNTLTEFLKGKKYVIGNNFTVLDLYFTATLRWAIFVGGMLPNEGILVDYMNQHLTREANVKGKELDQKLAESMGIV
ncbi:glutathione S-transferase, N-terminal domain protein [Leptotrichia hongkongensis]|uniref:Glutathione S-transferase, N-terminal domain protein n=2 Tax=Leptotrichia hongkongensis TaxID=554406 RepID=A0A510L4J5_9FUSO|nr:glutathione S-transferase, N-terminal domain protein [Leptotrichia hongkongensis]